MSKSSRRVTRTTVAVVGMTAVGAMGSGTAFAQTATDLDRTPEGAGHTDLAGAEDGLGTAEQVGGVDLHTFQLPTLGDQTVKSSYLSKKKKDSDDDKDSDDKDSDDKDSDDDKKDKKKDRSDSKKKKSDDSDSSDDDDDDDDDEGGKHRKRD